MIIGECSIVTGITGYGNVRQSRKFISVIATDGFYRMKISTDPVGIHSLVNCITK